MRSLSIKIPNVSESLEAKLEALILGGAFWPDRPIASERRLSEELGVSRTSLRNALASLKDKGLLTQLDGRFFPTNVLAELLLPGLQKTASEDPNHLPDYWVLFFSEALALSKKKSQTSDKVEIQKAARAAKKAIVGEDPEEAVHAFDQLCRAVLDGCYNYFLSQADFALRQVMHSALRDRLGEVVQSEEAISDLIAGVNGIAAFEFEPNLFQKLFKPKTAVAPDHSASQSNQDVDPDASGLIEVVLRHPLSFEAIYELRLITEKHAAEQAASNASRSHLVDIEAHLDEMTVVADAAPMDYSALDTALHQKIAASTQNPVFVLIDKALAPVFSRTTNQWLKKHMEMRSNQSAIQLQHSQIVDAILRRDPAAAQREMVEHLAYVLRNLRFLREQDRLQEIAAARHLLS